MKKNLALLVFVLVAGHLFAQPIMFQRTYGGNSIDEGRCVRQTYDGGYILLCSTTSFGAGLSDIYLLKVDSLGNAQWGKTFGGANIEKAYSLEITTDSGFIMCGYTNSFGNGGYDFYVIRTDSSGNLLWAKTFGGTDWDFAHSAKQTSDGGFIISGDSYSGPSGFRNPLVVRINSSGDLLWQKHLTSFNDEYSNALGITNDDQYVLVGYSMQSRTNSEDITLHKLNSSGDSLWTKYAGDTTAEEAFSIYMFPDNGFAVVGSNKDNNNLNNLMARFTESGDSIWYKLLSPPGNELTYDISGTSDGNLVITGYADDSWGGGGKDFFITRTDTSGNEITTPQSKTFGSGGEDIAYSVRQTSDGGYVLCGSTTSFAPGPQAIYLIKVDSAYNTSSTVVIGIDELGKAANVNTVVFPNPASNYLTISTSQRLGGNKIIFELYSLIGEKIFSRSIYLNNAFEINRNAIPSASYYYHIIDTDNEPAISSGILILR
jgi:hypothetical protein